MPDKKNPVERIDALLDKALTEAEAGWIGDRGYTPEGLHCALTIKTLMEARATSWSAYPQFYVPEPEEQARG